MRPTKIGLIAHTGKPGVAELTHKLESEFSRFQLPVLVEANTAALAYQFADKVKKNPDMQTFVFEMAAPRILPNDHAQFRLEGKPR